MYRRFGTDDIGNHFGSPGAPTPDIARSGRLDALVALERIGTRRRLGRNEEIYAEGQSADCWFRVVSGTVRIVKLLADGRRHIAEFHYAGDSFGFDNAAERHFSAEAVDDVILMRYPRRAMEQLCDEVPGLARSLRDMALRDLAGAQNRMLLLGRMTAAERVASFLLEFRDRREAASAFDVPMSRNDIADYLGLTIETVCRVLSSFKRAGAIAIPNPHRIELRSRAALEAVCDG
jgi:CRP/FNR family nitrogen fixation transcriptional regulator